MILKPKRILVFSSESDDSVGLQIYRLVYDDSSFDIIFMDDEYRSTAEITGYRLPTEDGEDKNVDADELVAFFKEVEDIENVEYGSLGLFYDYDLGFEFTEEMIAYVVDNVDAGDKKDELRKLLSELSYVSKDWEILNWEQSKEMILENLNFLIDSPDALDRVESVISESGSFIDLVYPELFEMFLYIADTYDVSNLFARTRSKVFCLKTSAQSPYQELIIDADEFDESLLGEDVEIVNLDASTLIEWYDEFGSPGLPMT